jgi:hypothetical protein
MTRYTWALFVCSITLLAQDVPPPKPSDSGPSLEVTMKFIQDKLNEEGPVWWHHVWDDGSSSSETEISGAIADTKSCALTFRRRTQNVVVFAPGSDNSKVLSFDYKASFRDIKSLTVLPLSRSPEGGLGLQETAVVTIEVDLTQRNDTPIVSSKKGKRKKLVNGATGKIIDPRTFFLYLNNEETAHRLAKAITHAAELCGGGEKSRFDTTLHHPSRCSLVDRESAGRSSAFQASRQRPEPGGYDEVHSGEAERAGRSQVCFDPA